MVGGVGRGGACMVLASLIYAICVPTQMLVPGQIMLCQYTRLNCIHLPDASIQSSIHRNPNLTDLVGNQQANRRKSVRAWLCKSLLDSLKRRHHKLMGKANAHSNAPQAITTQKPLVCWYLSTSAALARPFST